jgi:hypothetical protein
LELQAYDSSWGQQADIWSLDNPRFDSQDVPVSHLQTLLHTHPLHPAHNPRLQALYSNGGYTYLDVRTQLEVEEVGKIKDSVNIPMMLASRKYDPETREKKLVKEPNTDFIRQVSSSSSGAGIAATAAAAAAFLPAQQASDAAA